MTVTPEQVQALAVHKSVPIKVMLHAALVELRDTPVVERDQHRGICAGVEKALYNQKRSANDGWNVVRELGKFMEQWSGGTGLKGYPVRGWPRNGMTERRAAIYAYTEAESDGSMWQGEYGKRRIALLDWLIEETKP